MKNQISKHISIAKHIVDGLLTIDSVKEFRSILRILPSDPALHRVDADLLARKKSTRTALARICKKFPNIELGLIDLLKARSHGGDGAILRKVRQTDRHLLPVKIDMQVYPGKSGDHPIVLDGYTRDVSIGGMCIVIDAGYALRSGVVMPGRRGGVMSW